jgi:phosphatidate cytidylyltransferase
LLKQRIITAALLAPLAIAAIFYLPLTAFALLFAGVLAIAAWEWGPLMGFAQGKRRLGYVLAVLSLIASLWFVIPLEHLWQGRNVHGYALNVLYLAVAWWLTSAVMTVLYPRYTSFWTTHRSIRGLFGLLTIVPTWLAFMILRSVEYQQDPLQGAQVLLYLFLMVWAADIGAYFVGKAFGKHKLMPNVSPGKTREGFIGGVMTACLVAIVIGLAFGWQQDALVKAAGLAMVISTISVLGDLNESMFKREAGVKDSGSILPGHGGILDRIDSLTATAPVFALCYVHFGW